jgi:putative ABC transport system permease protein
VPLPLSYNVRNVLQRPVSTFTTAVGVGLTIAIFIGALSLAAGFRAALVRTGSPDNVIVLRKGADSEIASGIPRGIAAILHSYGEVAADAQSRPLVSPEVVVVNNRPRVGQPGNSNVTVRGIDHEAVALRRGVQIVAGRWFEPGAAEVVVGRRITDRFEGCRLGDRVRFGQRDFTVVGLFAADGSSFESEIWGDNEVLMPVFRGEVFQSVTFRMRDPARFEAIRSELENDPRLGVDVQRESEFYAKQSETLANLIRILGGFITVIMGVGAVFGAMNTMFAAVGARGREIATLLVLGFSPFAIMVSFVIESVILSLLGGVIGCLMALPLNRIVTSTTNFSSFSELAFGFRVTPDILLTGLAVAAVMGLVGGFLPALKASRQPLAAALRGG